MQAWEVQQGELRLATVALPSPRAEDAVVAVRFSGVCGSDRAKLAPAWTGTLSNPWRPGHEIVGTEAQTGAMVAVDPLLPCGRCACCHRGEIQLCAHLRRLGWDLPGGLAEAVLVPRANVVTLQSPADPAHAVLADPMAVAIHGVRCGLRGISGRLGVIGSGVVAVCTAVYAASLGWDVHLVGRDAERADVLRQVLDKPHRSARPYALRGLIFCGLCDRRMQGHWANHMPYYRCRFGEEYALANRIHHPRSICLRQDAVLDPRRLARQGLRPHRLQDTLDEMAAAQELGQLRDQASEAARRTIAECDHKLTRYRAALEAGTDPQLVATWTAEVNAQRLTAQAQLRQTNGHTRMSRQEIAALVAALGDLLQVLHDADPRDKAEVYSQLGLRLTYQPGKQTVRAEAHLNPHRIGKRYVSEARR